MAITPGAVLETFNVTQNATQTINLPAYNVGDVIVLTVANNPDGTATIGTITSGPTGFTEIGTNAATGAASDGRLSRWQKVMNGTEGTSVSMTTSTAMSIGAIARTWQGVDNTTPIDAVIAALTTTNVSPDITTITDGAIVVRSILVDGAPGFSDSSIPASHTLDGTIVQNPPSNGMNLGMAYELQVTAGSAGTATWSGTGTEENRSGTFALRPGPTEGISAVLGRDALPIFDMDEPTTTIDIEGENFGATQGTGTVYLSDVDTLAGGVNEVDIDSAIALVAGWADDNITLNMTQLSASELDDLQALGPAFEDRYIIVVTDAADEYNFKVTLQRPKAFEMVLSGNFAPGSTTQRLTGFSGTFGGGRIEEAANPSATNTDLANDGNREDVWNIQAKPNSRDVSYDFRVRYGANLAQTITQTPQVTITGVVIVTMSGTVQAQAAGITGAIERVVTMSGTVQAQAAGITGAVERVVTMSGTVASAAAGVTGAVERVVTLDGTISSDAAAVFGDVNSFGHALLSGVVDSQAAGITGDVNSFGHALLSGTIAAQDAGITAAVERAIDINRNRPANSAGGDLTKWGLIDNPTVTATTVEDTSAVVTQGLSVLIDGYDSSETLTLYCYIEKDAIGKATRFPLVGLQFFGSTTESNYVAFDTSDGNGQVITSVDPSAVFDIVDATTHWLIIVQATSQDAGNIGAQIVLAPAYGASAVDWANSGAAQGEITHLISICRDIANGEIVSAGAASISGDITVGAGAAHTLSGTIQAQASQISGAIERAITLSGTIAAEASQISGAVERAITLSGTIQAGAADVTGSVNKLETLSGTIQSDAAGITGSVKRSIELSGTIASANAGISGAVVIAGNVALSGTIQAQAAAITGQIERVITSSGSVQADSAGITGSVNRNIELSGVLSSADADISGAVVTAGNITLSGAIGAQAASISGNVERAVTISGLIQSDESAVIGGVHKLQTLSGTLQAADAQISGSVVTAGQVVLSGVVQAQSAQITGTIERIVTASGSLVAQSANISGVVERVITTSGTVQASNAAVSGAVERVITLSGTVQAESANISGSVVTAGVHVISGSPQAQSASIIGQIDRAITISGIVSTNAATIIGSIELQALQTISGTVQAQTALVTGDVERVVTMSGLVGAQGSIIVGDVLNLKTLSGTIQAQGAGISGAIERAITLSGTVASADSGINGLIKRTLEYQGTIAAQAPTMIGNIIGQSPDYIFPENRVLYTDAEARGPIVGDPQRGTINSGPTGRIIKPED